MKSLRNFLDRYQKSLNGLGPKRSFEDAERLPKGSKQPVDQYSNRMKDLKSPQPFLSDSKLDFWKAKLQANLLDPVKKTASDKVSSLSKKGRGYLAHYKYTASSMVPKSLTDSLNQLKRQQPVLRQSYLKYFEKAKSLDPAKEFSKWDKWLIEHRDKLSESISPFISKTVKAPLNWWQKARKYASKTPDLTKKSAYSLKDSLKETMHNSKQHVDNYFKANREWFAQYKPQVRSGGFIDRMKNKLGLPNSKFNIRKPQASSAPSVWEGWATIAKAPATLVKSLLAYVYEAIARLIKSLVGINERRSSWFQSLNLKERGRKYKRKVGMKFMMFSGFLVFMYALGTTLPYVLLTK